MFVHYYYTLNLGVLRDVSASIFSWIKVQNDMKYIENNFQFREWAANIARQLKRNMWFRNVRSNCVKAFIFYHKACVTNE